MDFLISFSAATVSGALAKTIGAPIDRIKLLMQVQHVNPYNKESKAFDGPIDCVRRVLREQGFRSLWRGNLAAVLRHGPQQGFNFGFKEMTRKLLGLDASQSNQKLSYYGLSLLSGGVGGSISLLMLYPFDFARTRLAVDAGSKFRNMRHLFSETYKAYGVRGIYQGLGVSFGGVFVFRSIFLGGHDVVKHYFNISSESTILKRYLSAQFITTLAATIAYPLDTTRRTLMMNLEDLKRHMETPEGSKGFKTWQAMRFLLLKGRARVEDKHQLQKGVSRTLWQRLSAYTIFYSGFSVNLVRGVSGAMILLLYDELKVMMNGK